MVMAGSTFQAKLQLLLDTPSLAVTVGKKKPTLAAPAMMVPEMSPLEGVRLTPVGRPAAL